MFTVIFIFGNLFLQIAAKIAKISCHMVGKEAISLHSHGQDANPTQNYPQH